MRICEGNVLVPIEMLISSVMGVISMSREFFSTLVGMMILTMSPKKAF